MVNLVIKAETSNQKNVTTTITYINPAPEVTNSVLLQFAKKLNALTLNGFESASKQTSETILE